MGQGKIYLMALAGGYLVYLGIQQFIALFKGQASLPWLNAVAGVLFVAIGGAVLVREWKAYKAAQAPRPAEDDEEEEEEETEEEETEEEEAE